MRCGLGREGWLCGLVREGLVDGLGLGVGQLTFCMRAPRWAGDLVNDPSTAAEFSGVATAAWNCSANLRDRTTQDEPLEGCLSNRTALVLSEAQRAFSLLALKLKASRYARQSS